MDARPLGVPFQQITNPARVIFVAENGKGPGVRLRKGR